MWDKWYDKRMFPLEVFINVLVAVIMVGFWLVAFVIFYHLTRFGVGILPKKLAALFLIGSLAFFVWSTIAYYTLDLTALSL